MTLKMKTLAAAAALSLTGISFSTAAMFTTGTAQASTPGCAFTNGCGTLKGTDANGSSVAMDAKGKNKTEILIGYADNAGDGATSFDSDLHYGKGIKTTTYADTGFQLSPTFTTLPVVSRRPLAARDATVAGCTTHRRQDRQRAHGESTRVPLLFRLRPAPASHWAAAGTFTLDEEYANGTSCVAAYKGTVIAESISPVTAPN